jgi:hypothetical protein
MPQLKKYDSALREDTLAWIKKIGDVDILVGIPCYNNEDTVAHVVSRAAEGLESYYPDRKGIIFVSDGGSLDYTREKASAVEVSSSIERKVAIYKGLPGKGTAFRAIFEVATLTKADISITLDSDLRSVTPEWIKLLAQSIFEGKSDFVAPYYKRHKYDGSITNNLIYPLTRSLYGLRIRQPIGGEFGFNGNIAAFYSEQDVWDTDVAKFGIDAWMITCVINERKNIVQANLGTKVHDAKDPSEDLGPMFRQVISTFFYLAGKYENRWRSIKGSKGISIEGKPSTVMKLEPVSVNLNKLQIEFEEGFGHFRSLYNQILEEETFEQLKESVRKSKKKDKLDFSDELWAKVVYDFYFMYKSWDRNRRKLIDILLPLYFGRTCAFCDRVSHLEDTAVEEVIEKQALKFEELKQTYLKEKIREWQ